MSVDHASLYAAILANPDDDAPRLAFADQLEREGDAARAELIRRQCAYARMSKEEQIAAWPPIAELLKTHAGEWLKGLSAVATARDLWRGFLDSASGTSADFVELAGVLEGVAPLNHISVEAGASEGDPDLVPGFLELPLLERVRALHLGEGTVARSLAEVLKAPKLAALKQVSIYDPEGFPEAMEEIAASMQPALRMFTVVGFVNTDFNDGCAEVLARAPTVAKLEHLRLWNCRLREAGAQALARSQYLGEVRALDLGLGQYSLNKIGPVGCAALAEEHALPKLTSLDLDFNEVGDEGWLAMVRSGKLGRFTRLQLQKCELGDVSLVPMFSSGRLDALVTLDLSHNQMGAAGAIALVEAAPASLRNLWLYGNPIGDEGVRALAQAPWLGQLRELNLDLVGMTDAGVEALLASPHLDVIPRFICGLQKPALSKSTLEALKARLGARLVKAPITNLRVSE